MSVAKQLMFERWASERPKIVARSRSRHGGLCQHNGCPIERGEPICKVDVGARGGSTQYGQGLGQWWCEPCAITDATD